MLQKHKTEQNNETSTGYIMLTFWLGQQKKLKIPCVVNKGFSCFGSMASNTLQDKKATDLLTVFDPPLVL